MFEIEISGAKKLARFAKVKFAERAVAFEYAVVRGLVEDILEKIKDGIPDSTQDAWMAVYKESLKIYEIGGLPTKVTKSQTPELGFVIASEVSGDWTMVDAAKMLVTFKRKRTDPISEIGKVLRQFSPFTVDSVPNLEVYGASPVIKVVRPSEVEEIREANRDKAHELQEALTAAGAVYQSGPAKIEGKVFFDMEWAVIRMETGHSAHGQPHWRPALSKINVFLRKQHMSVAFRKEIKKIFTPENVRWKAAMKGVDELPEIRVFDLKVFEEFQTKIHQSHM